MAPLVPLLLPIVVGHICDGIREALKDKRAREQAAAKELLDREKNTRLEKIEDRLAATERLVERLAVIEQYIRDQDERRRQKR